MKFNIFPGTIDAQHIEFKRTDYDNIKNNLSYGGFLEKRIGIDNGVHLGVDISVDPKTSITVPCACTVADVYIDKNELVEKQLAPQAQGWGGRIIFKLDNSYDGCDYLIYGHLGHSLLAKIGDKVVPGDIVGHVAELDESGTWFPHVHVQLITKKFYSMFEDDLENIDGYCHDMDEDVSSLVSDPIGLIMLNNEHHFIDKKDEKFEK